MKVQVTLSKEEIQLIKHALLLTGCNYLRQGTEGGRLNNRDMNAIYDKLERCYAPRHMCRN